MRKRITALTMAGVMTAALLSGCSGGNSTSTTTAGGAADTTGAEAAQTTAGGTEAAAAGEKVEITYWDQLLITSSDFRFCTWINSFTVSSISGGVT